MWHGNILKHVCLMTSSQNFPSGHGFKAWLMDVGFVMDRSSTGSGFLGVLCFPWIFHYFLFFFPHHHYENFLFNNLHIWYNFWTYLWEHVLGDSRSATGGRAETNIDTPDISSTLLSFLWGGNGWLVVSAPVHRWHNMIFHGLICVKDGNLFAARCHIFVKCTYQ